MSMTPAEMRVEVHAAAANGAAGLWQLEPHSARALLLAANRLSSGQHGGASVQSVEQCMQAVRAARQQGSRIYEVHAAAESLRHTMVLLAGLGLGSMEDSTAVELGDFGEGAAAARQVVRAAPCSAC